MQKFKVGGMSCAACSARVEKAVSSVDGVKACSVNLLTGDMSVEGGSAENIVSAVKAAGYEAEIKDKSSSKQPPKKEEDKTKPLKLRLIYSSFFLIALMYVSMGHIMWGWWLPSALSQNYLALGLIQLILTSIVMVINQRFFISGFKALFNRSPNMDSLVALGSAAAFVYSVYALFSMSSCYINGNVEMAAHYLHELYFESSAMILTLITVGKLLETVSKGRATNAVNALIDLAPKSANVIRDNREINIPISELLSGDIFIVRPGEAFSADGIVISGESAVDESALTGESMPVDKKAGDTVSCATINKSGTLRCKATSVGEESNISRIISMVTDAAASKAPIARLADKISGVFVPVVILIAVVTTAVWLILGEAVGFALARGISVLVISCPCALGLATPVAVMVGSTVSAKHGILFKTAAALEQSGRIKIAVFDKTGTVTSGKPSVTDIVTVGALDQDELLSFAASVENESSHPLALAVCEKASERGISINSVSDFKEISGVGVSCKLNENMLFVGKLDEAKNRTEIKEEYISLSKQLAESGKTPLFLLKNDVLEGIIAVADSIREDSAKAISRLKALGIKTVMLTGDNGKTAKAVADICGIDEVISDVLPAGKAEAILSLKAKGATAMIGDGINDAVALSSADLGIAIGAGTDIAIDAADVVVMRSRLSDVVNALRLGRTTLKNIRENLFWAFIYNIIGIPLATGIFIHIWELQLNPMFAAAAMSLSSFCVVSNALRLNLFKAESEENKNLKKSEERIMKKTIYVEGMMCGHCSGRVKSVLEQLDGVVSAEVSHETGIAAVTLNSEVSNDTLKGTVEAQGYNVTKID